MNKKKAINLLKSQINKLRVSVIAPEDRQCMLVQTKSHILKIFGKDSHEYKFISEYYMSIGEDRRISSFLNDCIETVSNFGVAKSSSIWRRLETMNQMVLWSIVSFIAMAIFTMGIISTKINF